MVEIFETIMLICFGLSWPINAMKSYKSRTAKGKSVLFEVAILLGYFSGIAGKIVGGNITYVLALYILNTCMVLLDLALVMRNIRLDKIADGQAQ